MVREILDIDKYKPNQYGTHYFYVKYKGDFDDLVLINACDTYTSGEIDDKKYEYLSNNKFNWGGFVEPISDIDGVKKARVGVYYD